MPPVGIRMRALAGHSQMRPVAGSANARASKSIPAVNIIQHRLAVAARTLSGSVPSRNGHSTVRAVAEAVDQQTDTNELVS